MNLRSALGIERLALVWAVAVAVGGAGSCDSKPLQVDAGPGAGGSIASGRGGTIGEAGGSGGTTGSCNGIIENVFCLPGNGETVTTCGDVLMPAGCLGGQWACPPGQGVPTRCLCPGLVDPRCVCGSAGWECGGAPGRGGAGGQGGTTSRGGAGGAVGGGGASGAGGGGGGCPLPRLFCNAGNPDSCSDVAMPATCKEGQWVCSTGIPGPCRCFGPPRPGCVCTDNGFQCSTGGAGGRGGAGGTGGAAGQSGGAGGGGRGGSGGGAAGAGGGAAGAGGAGGNSVACADVTTLEKCDARTDCHSVFEDPHNCACLALGCCARFLRCADGDRARCTSGPIGCDALAPYCESPYVVSYTGICYEGCVRATECQ